MICLDCVIFGLFHVPILEVGPVVVLTDKDGIKQKSCVWTAKLKVARIKVLIIYSVQLCLFLRQLVLALFDITYNSNINNIILYFASQSMMFIIFVRQPGDALADLGHGDLSAFRGGHDHCWRPCGYRWSIASRCVLAVTVSGLDFTKLWILACKLMQIVYLVLGSSFHIPFWFDLGWDQNLFKLPVDGGTWWPQVPWKNGKLWLVSALGFSSDQRSARLGVPVTCDTFFVFDLVFAGGLLMTGYISHDMMCHIILLL